MSPVLSVLMLGAWLAAGGTDFKHCVRCHDETGWRNAHFDHDTTKLPLRDRHAEAPCHACHKDLHRLPLNPACGSCHTDVHAGRLGANCTGCHTQVSFSSGAGVMAHAMSRFPLLGRHAEIPCETCHQDRADRTFGGVTRSCLDCHSKETESTVGTGIDHSGMSNPECRRCHNPVTWLRAAFPDHETCFPIIGRPHQGIACLGCHTALRGLAVNQCTTFTASCTRCHHCNTMDASHRALAVPGYQCADRKCFECHPDGKKR